MTSIQRRPDPDSRNERLVDARTAELALAALASPPPRDARPGRDGTRGDARSDSHRGRAARRRHWRARSAT